MMRRTVNEVAVMCALKKEFVQDVFEYGMYSQINKAWFACSPEGIVIIDASLMGLLAVPTPQLFSVKIKTSVAASSVNST